MAYLGAVPGLAQPGLAQPGNPGGQAAPPGPAVLGYAAAGDTTTAAPSGYGHATAGTWP